MNFDAVLFDLDGTLLDTLEDLADATNRTLVAHGYKPHAVDDYRRMVGWGIVRLVEAALPVTELRPDRIRELAGEVSDLIRERPVGSTRAYPGVTELLEELSRRAIPFAVLSNKPEELTRLVVGKLLGTFRFAEVRGSRSGVPPKPDPEGALLVARRIGIAPERFLYAGDSNVDMATANAAGMYAVGVTWGFRSREELAASGARSIIDRPAELTRLL